MDLAELVSIHGSSSIELNDCLTKKINITAVNFVKKVKFKGNKSKQKRKSRWTKEIRKLKKT